jgi:hypothetical protein
MSSYPNLKTRVLQMLNDAAGVRYVDVSIQEAMRQALVLYNGSLPQVKIYTITADTAGRIQSLAALAGLIRDLAVQFPIDAESEPQISNVKYFLFFDGGVPKVYFVSGDAPAVADQFQVMYLAAHTIAGLDEAAITTLPVNHEEAFLTGAAAFACLQRAHNLLEAYGDRSPDVPRLEELSDRWMQYFLGFLASTQIYQPSFAYPEGFRMDRWDAHGLYDRS